MKNDLLNRIKDGNLTTDQAYIISNLFPEQINEAADKATKDLDESEFTEETDKRIWDKIKAKCTK